VRERFDADGERWSVTLDRGEEAPGVNALVFHCLSNPQRPYRVVRISETDATRDPGELEDGRLRALFADAQIMDYVRDRDAIPEASASARQHSRERQR
jgi:hypothetical protein